jgi:phosphopantothenoylcysteine decarboxylase/phosphopantothenate--cysteine ligase
MRFLITAGATQEYIDPVRFISNASSGKMGYAIARAVCAAGHEVVLISGPTHLEVPAGVEFVSVVSAAEMFSAVKEYFGECDCLVMSAAVSDYAPARRSAVKMKKSAADFELNLEPTVDILKWAGSNKGAGQLVVGFALEDTDVLVRAEGKLRGKNLDMIVANEPGSIGAEETTVMIKSGDSAWITIADSPKEAIAEKLIVLIEEVRSRG